ncbi:MAG: MFS transporter [Synergistaceae bacterium]|nr:MFS transporter [Synergistaceae bacterium]
MSVFPLQRAYRPLFRACLFSFLDIGVLSLILGSMLPDLRAAYGLSPALAGFLLAVYSVGNLSAGIVGGAAALLVGQRPAIVLLSALSCLGMLALGVWGAPAFLLLGFFAVGLGRGAIVNFGTRAVNILTDGSPVASNLLHAFFALGAILAPVVFFLLRNALGWKAGLALTALLGAATALTFFRVPMPEGGADGKAPARGGSMIFLRDPAFLVLALMMFCYLSSEYAINGWLVTYIQHKESLAASLSGPAGAYSQMMAAVLWGVVLVGRLVCAALSGRVSQKTLLLASSLGAAAFFGGMLAGDDIRTVTICVAGLGFCMAGISPLIFSSAAYFTNNFPMATGTLYLLGGTGGALMPFLIGFLAGRFGFSGGMAAILGSFSLLTLFSVVNLFIRPFKRKIRL